MLEGMKKAYMWIYHCWSPAK